MNQQRQGTKHTEESNGYEAHFGPDANLSQIYFKQLKSNEAMFDQLIKTGMPTFDNSKSAPNSSYRLQRTRRLENINIQGKKFGQSKIIFESQSTKPKIKVNLREKPSKSIDLG